MKRLIRLIISVLCIMVLLAGCSNADAASATETSAPEEVNTTVTDAGGDSSGDASGNASESVETEIDWEKYKEKWKIIYDADFYLNDVLIDPESEVLYLEHGKDFEIRAAVDKNAVTETLTYKWQYSGTELYIDDETTVDHIAINNAEHAGHISCAVYDSQRNVFEWIKSWSVEIDNNLVIWPKNYTKEEYADRISSPYGTAYEKVSIIDGFVELEVLADADDEEGISYLWQDQLNNVLGTDSVLVLNDLNKLEADPSYKNDNGTGLGPLIDIKCVVADKYDNQKSIVFHLYWENHLIAYAAGTGSMETDIYVDRGDRIELCVDVSADDMSGIKYYWLWLDEQNHKAKRFLNLNEDTCLTDPIEGDCVYEVRIRDQFMNWRSVRFNIYVDQ